MKVFSVKLFSLFKEIILCWFGIIKRVVLPGKKRKGNILSSIFDLFTGTIEKVETFEYGIFKMATLFRYKFIQQALFILCGLLLLLSSFEWDNSTSAFSSGPNLHEITSGVDITEIRSFPCKNQIKVISEYRAKTLQHVYNPDLSVGSSPVICLSPKIYLLFRSIRI